MPDRTDTKDQDIRSWAFWSGTITFGLVSVPVVLFPGNRAPRVSLRMLSPEGIPLRRRYYCPKEDRLVGKDEIVRGYEYEKDRFVLITDEELESLEPKKSREIDLRRFVPVEQIDPMYFDRAYFFAPTGDSQKAYRLLAEVMEKTGRAGIATFVMRGKEYLIAILSENGILRAETLRFPEEIRKPEDIGLPQPNRVPESTLKEMDKEIEGAAAEKLDFGEMEDQGSKRLLELIERKRAAGEGVIRPPQISMEEEEEEEGGKVIDFMEVLKRSIEKAGPSALDSRKKGAPAGASGKKKLHNLQKKSKKDLYDSAKKLDIPGRSTMGKEELIEAIQDNAAL